MAHAIPADANMQEHQRVDSKDVLRLVTHYLTCFLLTCSRRAVFFI